jgi:hypothetical protein
MTAAYVALAMVQTSKTLDTQEGTCGVWKSQDALSSILVVTVWELTDDVPVKSDYGFPFTFAVDKAGLRTTMATGYAHINRNWLLLSLEFMAMKNFVISS